MTDSSIMDKTSATVKELVGEFETKLSSIISDLRELKGCLKDLDKGHKVELKDASKNIPGLGFLQKQFDFRFNISLLNPLCG